MGAVCTTLAKDDRRHDHIFMIAAAASGDVSKIEFLVQHKADIDARDRSGRSALHLASSEGHVDIVRFLVERGARVNVKDRWDNEPIQEAILRGHDRVVSLLLQCGAKLSSDWKSEMEMKLRNHVGKGNLVDVKHLVESGISINSADYLGRTPLHIAAEHGRSDLLEYLISKNADIHQADQIGETALTLANRERHQDIQLILRKAGACGREVTRSTAARKGYSFRKSSLGIGAAVVAASFRDFFVPKSALLAGSATDQSSTTNPRNFMRKSKSLLDLHKEPRPLSMDPAESGAFQL